MKFSPEGLQLTAWTGCPSWGSISLRGWTGGGGEMEDRQRRGSSSGLKEEVHQAAQLPPPAFFPPPPLSHLKGLMSDFMPLKSYTRTM